MKKIVLSIFLTVAFISYLFSQNWTQKQSLGGDARHDAVGFSINGKGYVALGNNGTSQLNDVWEYDPNSDSWSQKSSFLGNPRRAGVAFTIGSSAYVGSGWTGSNSYFDYYKYDPTNNSWTKIADYPGNGARHCFGTSTQGKGYVGGGTLNSNMPFASDFWEYDPSTNSWSNKGNLPLGSRLAGIAFGIDDMVYLGLGHDGSSDYNDLWAYNTTNGTWNQLTSFPGSGRLNASSFVVNGKAIVGGGYRLGVGTELSDYYEYDPATNSWSPVISFANGARSTSVEFTIGQAGYLSTGFDGNKNDLNDLWKYSPSSSVNELPLNNIEINLYPVPNNGILHIQYEGKRSQATFKLFNTLGELILTKNISDIQNHMTVDLSEFPEGNYYYHFLNDEGMTSGQFPLMK